MTNRPIGSFQKFVYARHLLTPKGLKELRVPSIQPAYLDTNVENGKIAVVVVLDMDDDWSDTANQDRHELPRASRLLCAHCRG